MRKPDAALPEELISAKRYRRAVALLKKNRALPKPKLIVRTVDAKKTLDRDDVR